MRDKLIELIKGGSQYICDDSALIERLADHLLTNGVVVLPVEIGKKIYDATEFFEDCDCPEIYELKDDVMYIEKVGKDRFLFTYDGIYIHPENIGKTVFLTKEEAEAAVAERIGE
ncbi:MAG: hypothetical protein UHG68_08800 [Clostridia bacterium]|nr:hypothetical protein [Clostridia bacterium]